MLKDSEHRFFENIRRTIKTSYFVASLIPLSVLTYLSLRYIYPLMKGPEGEALPSIWVVLLLTVALSLLGFMMSVKATNRALASIQDAYTKLDSLLEITKHFRDTFFVDLLLERIVKSATELLAAETGSLLLADEEGLLRFKVALGEMGEKVKDRSIRPGEGITGWVLQTGNSAIVNDVAKDERFNPGLDSVTGFKTTSVLCVPMIYQGRTIGVLEVLNKRSGGFTVNDERLLFSLADQAAVSIMQSRARENQHEDMIQMTEILINAMDTHTPMKEGHPRRVAMYATAIGKQMDLGEERLRRLYFAAVLHDIGLLRFEYLEHWEEEKFRQHPRIGYEMVTPISAWKEIAPVILHHHERYDGKGYPSGRKGEEIPLGSRIIAVADAFDVLTSEKTYRERLPLKEAVEEIERNAGTQFDPAVVAAFKAALKQEKFSDYFSYL